MQIIQTKKTDSRQKNCKDSGPSRNSNSFRRRKASRSVSTEYHRSNSRRQHRSHSSPSGESCCCKRRKMYSSPSSSEGSKTSRSQKRQDSSHVTDYLKKLDKKLCNLETNIPKNNKRKLLLFLEEKFVLQQYHAPQIVFKMKEPKQKFNTYNARFFQLKENYNTKIS